jgi:hypothetical protein
MRLNIKEVKDAAPKPKLIIRTKSSGPSALGEPWSLWSVPFQRLVQEAMEAAARAARLEAPGAQKLSAPAFLRETLRIQQGATVARVEQLRRRLDSGDLGFEFTRSALRKMIRELKIGNLRTPPTAQRWEERHRAMFLQPRVTEVLAELSAAGFTALELFGVAILIAGKTPGVFGTSDGEQKELDANIAEATKRRDELFARIGKEWTAAEVDAGQYARGHTSAATIRGTSTPLAPAETLGKRLVESLNSSARLVEFLQNQRAKQP